MTELNTYDGPYPLVLILTAVSVMVLCEVFIAAHSRNERDQICT